MIIYYRTKKLQKICNISKEAVALLGLGMAKKLQQRLTELRAADVLSQISHLPPARCHELVGRRAGQFSVDLVHPYRLLFVPADERPTLKDDGGVDLDNVREIEIFEIADTH